MDTSSPEFVLDRTEKEINVEVQDSETAVQDTEKAANGIEVDLQEKAEEEPETVSTEVDRSTGVVKKTAALDWLLENKLDKKSIDEYLEHLSEKEDLQEILKELE